jgi:hypothetical protein
MKKSIWGFIAVGILLGGLFGYWRAPKGDPLAELLPADLLKGYIEGTKVAIMTNAKGHSITGGSLLLAESWAPAGIAPESLLPTVYGAVKAVLQENRKADVVRLFLAEDSLRARAYQWCAIAEYRRGRITVTGGFPTPAQLDSLRKIGVEARPPKADEAILLAEIFDKTGGLAADRLELSQSLSVPATGAVSDRFYTLPLETPVLAKVGKAHGLNVQQVRDAVLAINRYYWLNTGRLITVLE